MLFFAFIISREREKNRETEQHTEREREIERDSVGWPDHIFSANQIHQIHDKPSHNLNGTNQLKGSRSH